MEKKKRACIPCTLVPSVGHPIAALCSFSAILVSLVGRSAYVISCAFHQKYPRDAYCFGTSPPLIASTTAISGSDFGSYNTYRAPPSFLALRTCSMVQELHGSNGESISAVPAWLVFSTHTRRCSTHFARHLTRGMRDGDF
jgi:hypothetical protein